MSGLNYIFFNRVNMQDLQNKNIVNSQFQQQGSATKLTSKTYDIAIVGYIVSFTS